MTDESEKEISALATPFVVRAAAALQAVSGLYLAISAIQLLVSLRFVGELAPIQYLNWAFIPLGVLQILAAARLLRMRAGWGWVALALALVVALGATSWVALNVFFGIFSCMQLGTVSFAWIALVLTPFTIGPLARASRARRALERDGMSLGL